MGRGLFVRPGPPRGLGVIGTAAWWRLYDTASRVYTQIPQYYVEDAIATASVGARAWYRGGRLRPMPRLSHFPDPGDLVTLGTFIEIDAARQNGKIEAIGFGDSDGIPLWWSKKLSACFVYPFLRGSACKLPPNAAERRLVRTWTDGNYRAACAAEGQIPRPRCVEVLPALAVTYLSTKFSRTGEIVRYVHHHEDNVHVYLGPSVGGAPQAIMLRGGRLRLTTHGLDG